MPRRPVEPLEPALVLEKTRHYCGYQERCIRDVEGKLKDWAVQREIIQSIIKQMQEEGFLDEKRFAKAFARGKFKVNKWGRQKIEFELKIRGIPKLMITKGIASIDETEYLRVLEDLILRKQKEFNRKKDLNIREKILNFVVGKGYEMELTLGLMKTLKI